MKWSLEIEAHIFDKHDPGYRFTVQHLRWKGERRGVETLTIWDGILSLPADFFFLSSAETILLPATITKKGMRCYAYLFSEETKVSKVWLLHFTLRSSV